MPKEEKLAELKRMYRHCPEMLSPLKVSKWTLLGKNRVYDLIRSKEIKSFVFQGGYMIAKADLLEYLASHADDSGRRHYKIKGEQKNDERDS